MLCCLLQTRQAELAQLSRNERAVRQLLLEQKIVVGDLLDGVVTSLKDYGAFIDVGHGVNALLHRRQMSAELIASPAEVLAVRSMEPSMRCMQACCSKPCQV
jgi:ribosomal protein S1